MTSTTTISYVFQNIDNIEVTRYITSTIFIGKKIGKSQNWQL